MFELLQKDGNARAGKIKLAHGDVQTPVFMPVGTQGVIKGLDCFDVTNHLGAEIILGNTYHLYLRPTAQRVRYFGGLHGMSGYRGNFLTDSGGFQAFSLGGKRKEEGIEFKSHIDGSKHFFTPSKVLDIQYDLNSDIMMVLDDLVGLPASKERIEESIHRTTKWAQESLEHHLKQLLQNKAQSNHLFAIVQGGTDEHFRKMSATALVELSAKKEGVEKRFDGFAIGGLAVGESAEEMYETLDFTLPFLPSDRPRYLMGVGTPENILEAISRGVDMFDCVMPTRNARNGSIFTSRGKISIKSSIHALEDFALDEECDCYTCQNFSRGYLHHLFRSHEITYHRLATIHNLRFYLNLTRGARLAIVEGRFQQYKQEFYEKQRRGSGRA
ncbi:tRNA guanosine(34) transglycosylase Tgt [Helicobacter kayseriensis]|uniref:tRNA guanosine(34) transglycosylase Tgt n=1 Tax=Helicobacter kayseriensis TaxID=2905877 RepID=UPI001E5A1DC0|nr:tRNA guanosine(34) transglycosylase Tgt [Helicobacter kayseriensis]MCE3048821.1 tRNA guanosine(34) transglycosylase Tgt [Helicobacter kayseriensis]